MKPIKKSIAFGRHQLTLETGEIARQAHGAVMVTMDDTVVLVTVVGAKNVRSGQDFFPLTVDYQEKFYAAGRIPGSFFKREGRPSEKETLTCRLIDRPIRPLFPEGFYNEVQVVATVMSSDEEVDADILLWAFAGFRQFCDRQCRSVRGENAVFAYNRFNLGRHVGFDRHIFKNGLNNQVTTRQSVVICGGCDEVK